MQGFTDEDESKGRARPTPLSRRALLAAVRGGDAWRVRSLAREALGDLAAANGGSEPYERCIAALALVLVDDLAAAARALTSVVDEARDRDSRVDLSVAHRFRALAELRRGRIPAATVDFRRALDGVPSPRSSAGVHGMLAETLLEQAEQSEAARQIALGATHLGEGDDISKAFFFAGRAAVRAASQQSRGAIADCFTAGDHLARANADTPRVLPWRSSAAISLAHVQEQAAAKRLAEEHLELARACGDAGTVGRALHTCGLVEPVPRAVGSMREALELLRGTECVLDLARALADLGAAVRRLGDRTQSQALLREALDLADRCEARQLAARARRQLTAAGGKPRRSATVGPHALTEREWEVARLAAEGNSTSEISDRLFITDKTVEWHLGNVYRKLGVSHRHELAAVMFEVSRAD